MSLLCGTPGGSVDIDATRVTTRDPGRNEALWITTRAEKCLWIAQGIPVLLTGEAPPPTSAHSGQAPLVWRAPEGPEGTGGLRDGAPSEARSPSLAGGRGLRRLENPWSQEQHARSCWAAAHRHTQRPGSTGVEGAWKTRGAKNNMRDHAGPPPTGTHSGQVGRGGPCGTNSSRGLVSRTWEGPGIRRRTRGRRSPPRPRPTRYLPRSCGAGCRWTLPRRPGTRRGCAS